MTEYMAKVLNPALEFLIRARDGIVNLSVGVRQGIDLGQFLGPARILGPGFIAMIQSLMVGAVVIVIVTIVRGAYGLLLRVSMAVG